MDTYKPTLMTYHVNAEAIDAMTRAAQVLEGLKDPQARNIIIAACTIPVRGELKTAPGAIKEFGK